MSFPNADSLNALESKELSDQGQNSLERRSFVPYRFSKSRGPKVTIAIGIISENQVGADFVRPTIMLACDSQTTYPGGAKRLDAQKLAVVSFTNGDILVAQSGFTELGDKAIENMQRMAAGKSIESYETITKIAQESVRDVRDHQISLNRQIVTDWDAFFWEKHQLSLLIAFYFEKKPYLYTINIHRCVAVPSRDKFEAIGTGQYLAIFLLGEYQAIDPAFEYPFPIAVAVTGKTADNVDGCGKPVQVGHVYPMPAHLEESYKITKQPFPQSLAAIITKSYVEVVGKELEAAERKTAKSQKSKLLATLKRSSNKYFSKVMKRVNNEFGIKPPTSSEPSSSPS